MNLKIGTDILYMPNLKKIIVSDSFINKVYTKKEIEIASKYKEPLHFYATRFAAKEAIIKATGGLYDFKEIEIDKDENGKPIPKILNHPDIEIEISLSFDCDYAIAFCIVKN